MKALKNFWGWFLLGWALMACAAPVGDGNAPTFDERAESVGVACLQTSLCPRGTTWSADACTCLVCFHVEQCTRGTTWDPGACVCAPDDATDAGALAPQNARRAP